ncbi:MAG: antitoxin [Candidatus Asgardarchaeum sp.]|nr:antitoxin [Candidatus Odinarchaeota archaeon]
MNSTVLGIRIPKRLKEELERLKINYSEEVRKYLERRVREEKMKMLLEEIEKVRSKTKKIDENLSAKIIREDRDSR